MHKEKIIEINGLDLHWNRLKRSWGRRFRELMLPRGYRRFGTRYGGWWVDTRSLSPTPVLIDCGLGEDVSFPVEFTKSFPNSRIVGVEPNPRSLEYCHKNCPKNMEIIEKAFWVNSDEVVIFHLPRPDKDLPDGADGVSGSLHNNHEYVVGGDSIKIPTIDLDNILLQLKCDKCDVLKLDIEGAEYEVLNQLIRDRKIKKVDQLLVEFHHGVTKHTIRDTNKVVKNIISCGFDLIHTEGRNYIFRRL